MARFEPCHGKNACRDNGERCLTCGRESSENARLRACVDELANLAMEHGYDNSEESATYVVRKLFKTIAQRREQLQ